MAGIVSRLTVTGMSEVELDAWFSFLGNTFGGVGLSFYVAEFETQGDTTEVIYGVDGSIPAFAYGVPEVMKDAHAFAKTLALQHHTMPDKYVASILLPIVNNCYVSAAEVEALKQKLVAQFCRARD